MKGVLLLTILYFIFLFSCVAQNKLIVSGSLIDSLNSTKIPSGIISVTISRSESVKDSVRIILKSNNEGRFNFEVDKFCHLSIKTAVSGYKSCNLNFIAMSDTTLSLVILKNSNQLGEVKIISNLKNQFKLIAGGLSIEPDLKTISPSSFVLNYLKYVPGVTISSQGNISFSGQSLKLYVNGQLISLSGAELISYLQQMAVGDLSSVDILTEPGASFDASGSALINLHTKKFGTFGIQDVVAVGLTTHDKAYLNNSILFTKSNLKLSVNLLYNHSNFSENDYFEINSKDEPSLNSSQTVNYPETPQNSLSLSSGIDFRLRKNIQVGVYTSNSMVHGNYPYNYQLEKSIGSNNILSNKFMRSNRYIQNGYFQVDMKKGVFKIDFSNTYLKDNNITTNNLIIPDSSNTLKVADNINASKTNVFFVNINQGWNFIDKWKSNIGIKYSNNNLSNTFATSENPSTKGLTDYSENILAGFFESTYSMSKYLGIQGGLRIENTSANLKSIGDMPYEYKKSYINLFPSLGLFFKSKSGLNLSLYYTSHIDRPNYNQYIPFPESLNAGSISYNVGSNSLNPSRTNAVGIKLQKNFKNNFSFISNFSRSLINSPILTLPFLINSSIVNAPINVAQAQIYTFQFILSKRWKSLSLTFIPKFSRRYLNNSTITYMNQSVDVGLAGSNYFSINSNINFTLFKNFNNAIAFSYGTKQYSPFGYTRGMGAMSYNINKSFVKDRLNISLDYSEPFNWLKNYDFQSVSGVKYTSIIKNEMRMLYLSCSFRIGNVKATKTETYDYDSDSRVKDDRK
ncbi:outer membrane beta-barrel family protein [Pedobacter sp. D749]|uniref:outer membrane beta-barrel family protein n=1 Tax=Pedobacter sp. D749 TaxID=2856523 RepID=UPI001C595C66|nr:outer membrane beta-barrel family protein [Pedobacter sp. D749]QXU43168.1 outer membrane beta-barrel family protein [Pedobacter sp. D749]